VHGNVLRDAASLNKLEMLPWDVWGSMDQKVEHPERLDPVAKTTAALGTPTTELRALYEGDLDLRVPDVIQTLVGGDFVHAPWDDSRLD
jgi:hypothetical protein